MCVGNIFFFHQTVVKLAIHTLCRGIYTLYIYMCVLQEPWLMGILTPAPPATQSCASWSGALDCVPGPPAGKQLDGSGNGYI